jgi:hypothetical protein
MSRSEACGEDSAAGARPEILKKLTDHVGHEDATRITDTDLIGWKDALIASGLQPGTIDNHLIIAKSFFR